MWSPEGWLHVGASSQAFVSGATGVLTWAAPAADSGARLYQAVEFLEHELYTEEEGLLGGFGTPVLHTSRQPQEWGLWLSVAMKATRNVTLC